ncbi:hypothetical protein H6F96_10125 [Microcoleus sp. FACHB-53]|nr:hypothetical protein [Microcoleus sp. FACHB-53]
MTLDFNDNFEIIALNGVTGDCLTSDDVDQNNWSQRLKENPPEPELTPEQVEALRQEHEGFLTQLEALAVQAIAKGYWDEVYDHITCNAPETEDS